MNVIDMHTVITKSDANVELKIVCGLKISLVEMSVSEEGRRRGGDMKGIIRLM